MVALGDGLAAAAAGAEGFPDRASCKFCAAELRLFRSLLFRLPAFTMIFDDKLREYLNHSNIEWRVLDRSKQFELEMNWRSIFETAWYGPSKMRRGSKAEYEYLQQQCTQYLVIPFSKNVEGTPMHVCKQSINAYECNGGLVALGQFCGAEFFISPVDFEWTMVHTHEDHEIQGPYFIRREWVQ